MSQLVRTRGVGPAKAARLLAAFELAHRMAEHDEDVPELPIFDAEGLGRTLMRTFAPNTQERVGGVFLDNRQHVLHQGTIFAGTFDHALVSTREIIQMALAENATRVVLYHNHPSGDPTPSEKDIEFTKKLRASLELCDLALVDHIVVSRTKYVSMRNNGCF
jgi:DNA repair protein RadC